MTLLARLRLVTIIVMLLGVVAALPAFAQKLGPDGAPNPDASAGWAKRLQKWAAVR